MPSKPSGLTLEETRELLLAAGVRRTLSRVYVVQHLSTCRCPPTHAEIAGSLERFGFDLSTIFRALNDLIAKQIVHRLDLGDHAWRYLLRPREPVRSPLMLAVCVSCQTVEQLDAASRVPLDRRCRRWQVDEVLVRGRCASCQRALPPATSAAGSIK
jgi:Fe2+ or Zn2+ uptake regulation protein